MGKYNHLRYARLQLFVFCIALLTILLSIRVYQLYLALQRHNSRNTNTPVWVFRRRKNLLTKPTSKTTRVRNIERLAPFGFSPYIIQEESNLEKVTRTTTKPSHYEEQVIKTIAVFDPQRFYDHVYVEDFKSCAYTKCRMIHDFENADAVIFILSKLRSEPSFKKKKGQIWIFRTVEAPSRAIMFDVLSLPGYKSKFNLTVTFMLKSDIPNPYGRLIEVRKPLQNKDYDSIFRNKSKIAAWFVSHCPVRSRRVAFVERIKRRLEVDIFGSCGTLFCRNEEDLNWGRAVREKVDKTTCLPILSSQYKFYFAFENTLCMEYITEKFFKLFQEVDVIPVVRGGADYKKYFPPDMYVDAADFSTPENLADFLVDLAADKDRYIQYLKNKDRYRLVMNENSWRCKLCEKLHTADHMTYDDIHHWWTHNSCFDPQDSKEFW